MGNPPKENWNKLRKLLGYLKRKTNLPLILRANSVNGLKWWVDASYAAYDGMKGHTRGKMSMKKTDEG